VRRMPKRKQSQRTPFSNPQATGWAAVERAATTHDVESRATYLDDPALGRGMPVPLGDSEGDLPPGQLPVLLLEPREALAIQNEDGSYSEGQVELIIKAGMSRFGWPAALVKTVEGWSLRRTETGVELWDHGGLWAKATLDLEPEWVSAVVSFGYALVLYSCWLGIRTPPNHQGDFTVGQRRLELINARKRGLVAAAFVPWRK
jgi:hypothetical protein